MFPLQKNPFYLLFFYFLFTPKTQKAMPSFSIVKILESNEMKTSDRVKTRKKRIQKERELDGGGNDVSFHRRKCNLSQVRNNKSWPIYKRRNTSKRSRNDKLLFGFLFTLVSSTIITRKAPQRIVVKFVI